MAANWASIRIAVLNSAARHCAVCRRFSGVGIEVHHIVPRDAGGEDSFDNAAPLCFECHMYAGHEYYSKRHPRGTKYTSTEIRRARDLLYDSVATGRLLAPTNEVLGLSVRYLLVRDTGLALAIGRADLTGVPWAYPTVVFPNQVSAFHAALIETGTDIRPPVIVLGHWNDEESYLMDRGDSGLNAKPHELPYFVYSRPPSEEDIDLARHDPATSALLDCGYDPGNLFTIAATVGGCGTGITEILYLRDIVQVFLCLRNELQYSVSLRSLDGLASGIGCNPRSFDTAYEGAEQTIELPQAAIEPGAMVMIPAATILAPLDNADDRTAVTVDVVPFPQYVSVQLNETAALSVGHLLVGPAILPRRLAYDVLGRPHLMPLHRLDPERVYSLSKSLLMGSCPYLFAKYEDGWRYLSEVCTGSAASASRTTLELFGASAFLVAEIDDQCAVLQSIHLDGVEKLSTPIPLAPGQVALFSTGGAREVEISGYHVGRPPSNIAETAAVAKTSNESVRACLRLLLVSDIWDDGIPSVQTVPIVSGSAYSL